MEDIINLRKGNIIVEDYSLKFTLMSKYDPSLVSNSRDEISRFVLGFTDLVKEECHMAMLL